MIEALLYTGQNVDECFEFCDVASKINWQDFLMIHTLEGPHKCSIGDYIIKGVNGEFYPCKPDIFKKTYEEV